jgi:hypothetical protein
MPKGIAPNYDRQVPAFYANFANVSSTAKEVFIDFCLVTPPYSVDAKTELIQAPVIVRIISSREFAQAVQDTISAHLLKDQKRQISKS